MKITVINCGSDGLRNGGKVQIKPAEAGICNLLRSGSHNPQKQGLHPHGTAALAHHFHVFIVKTSIE
jgi:hypothetical protein